MKNFKCFFFCQFCCICIKEDDFDLKGSETDVAGILYAAARWRGRC